MGVERKFIQNGLTKAQMTEYFARQLDRAGYGGMNITRTPMGTQITIFAEKPGMIIGKGGRTIRRLTQDMETLFKVDNPQIDVQEVKVPELNAQMMASRLASAIERGLYFRKAGTNMLRRIMDAGALGCEIDIAGKLTGPRKRTQKFVEGNILHSGKPAEELVDAGFAIAVKKLGIIGCRVRIVQPMTKLPGRFTIRKIPEVKPEEKVEEPGVQVPAEAPAEAPKAKAPEKPRVQVPAETPAEAPKVEAPEMPGVAREATRVHEGIEEHKHESYDYWHPVVRIHKEEKKEKMGAD